MAEAARQLDTIDVAPAFTAADAAAMQIRFVGMPAPEMLRELRHTAELRLFEPLDEEVSPPTGIEPVSDAAPTVSGETPPEPAESPVIDDPAQASPHGGAKPPSVE